MTSMQLRGPGRRIHNVGARIIRNAKTSHGRISSKATPPVKSTSSSSRGLSKSASNCNPNLSTTKSAKPMHRKLNRGRERTAIAVQREHFTGKALQVPKSEVFQGRTCQVQFNACPGGFRGSLESADRPR